MSYSNHPEKFPAFMWKVLTATARQGPEYRNLEHKPFPVQTVLKETNHVSSHDDNSKNKVVNSNHFTKL